MDNSQRFEQNEHAYYLLGFSSRFDRIDPKVLAVLEQFGVEHQDAGAIKVWFKQIERTEFEGPLGEQNLSNLEWLTPRVLAHESVVSNISQRVPFYPSRFGTLFSAKERMTELSMRNVTPLVAFLQRIRGKQEWGMKFFSDNARFAAIVAQRDGILQDGKPTSGVNYLKLRQLQRAQSHDANSAITSQMTMAIDHIRLHYQDVTTRPLYSSKDNAAEQLVGNIAILMDHSQTDALLKWAEQWNVEQYNTTAMKVQVTGPWPCYSFCPALTSDTEVAEAA